MQPPPEKNHPTLRWPGITAIGLLAIALGGSTTPGPIGLLWILMGLLMAVAPPQNLPHRFALTAAGIVLALAAVPLLPPLLGEPAWHETLRNLGLAHRDSLSPQSALSLEALLMLASGLLWALFILAQPCPTGERRRALQLHVAGVAALAAIAIASRFSGISVPLWPTDVFGFFPNRNQSAQVIALSGILVLGMAAWAAVRTETPPPPSDPEASPNQPVPPRRLPGQLPPPGPFVNRRPGLWMGLLSLPVLLTALIVCGSRAGIGLFFIGGIAITLCGLRLFSSAKAAAISTAALLLLMGSFLLLGGQTLGRFQQSLESGGELRMGIQADALSLSLQNPLTGTGLANFAPAFALQREKSVRQNQVIHPESDWLWAAVELGWPCALLLAAAALWWLRSCFPFIPGTDPLLRATTSIAAAAFLIHGLVDVSGHRFGSLLPALLLFGLAADPRKTTPATHWARDLWRTAGILLAIIGGLVLSEWVAASTTPSPDPVPKSLPWALPSQSLARIRAALVDATREDDYERIVSLADAGLEIAPLDWELRFRRACASVQTLKDPNAAAKDFALLRKLQPRWVNICREEGRLWAVVGDLPRALDAWQEALRRVPGSELSASHLFHDILQEADGRNELLLPLRAMAGADRDMLLQWMGFATPLFFQEETVRLLAADPALRTFSSEQRAALFILWHARGNQETMAKLFRDQPQLLQEGWRPMAQAAAERGAFEEACQLARRFTPRPQMPAIPTGGSFSQLEARFARNPTDLLVGLPLAQAQRQSGRVAEALVTVQALRKPANAPAYLAYMEAELHTQLLHWEQAWQAWQSVR